MSIKACILAGGLGTRLSEETVIKPKPMVEVGDQPILWHIMNIYASYGISDFVVALGYKGEYIKNYFLNYNRWVSDLAINLGTGEIKLSNTKCNPWNVELLDTGLNTHTSGRIRRFCEHVGSGIFLMTYGDGVANIDIKKLLAFHKSHGKLATVTAVHPPARFGAIDFSGDMVRGFSEKPYAGEGWINGGFFVLDAQVMKFITDDMEPFEQSPMKRLSEAGELIGYKHEGFWQCMDTLRDVKMLDELWRQGKAPWKSWNGDH